MSPIPPSGQFSPTFAGMFCRVATVLQADCPLKRGIYRVAQALLVRVRMNVSLYQAAAALDANSHWLDVISDNLASSSVPGYRKQTLARPLSKPD